MQRNEYPYYKVTAPIWINRDYELIFKLPIAYQHYTFASKLMLIDRTIVDFTVVKTVNTVNPAVLVELKLADTVTALFEADTIAKFDVKMTLNGESYTMCAGEIPIAKSIT